MPKRNTQERRQWILSLLQKEGRVAVDSLSKDFDISEVTIRKDLSYMESEGLLIRRYGGAVSISAGSGHESEKQLENGTNISLKKVSNRKKKIANAAAALINNNSRIIIDSGATTAALLPKLSLIESLVVMTNSLSIANALRELENPPTLLMTGGTWDPHSEAFQGKLAEQVLREYDFDQLFIGADGLDIERGTTTFNELYSLSQVMSEVTSEVIVMAESDKIGRRIHNLELPWSKIHTLVTDNDLPESAKVIIEKHDVKVVIAT